jgi:hypothetical protein
MIRDNRAGNASSSGWGELEVFPYPRRVVQVSFCNSKRIALFPSPAIDTDATATLATWLKPFGREPIVFSPSHFLPRAQIQVLSGADHLDLPYSDTERTAPNVSSGA